MNKNKKINKNRNNNEIVEIKMGNSTFVMKKTMYWDYFPEKFKLKVMLDTLEAFYLEGNMTEEEYYKNADEITRKILK